ncbi:MAG: hypothetical protein DRJ40_02835 [Thermoprotei archaeon]|nr:MAG: hypothetical protein DRJ40_02835 [Thermoprotei archaeon]
MPLYLGTTLLLSTFSYVTCVGLVALGLHISFLRRVHRFVLGLVLCILLFWLCVQFLCCDIRLGRAVLCGF